MEGKPIPPQKIHTLEKLKNSYQLYQKIGSGSFSVVYSALNIHSQRLGAIKIFTPHQQTFETTQVTFLNEINIMYKLRNIPGIPTIHNAGLCQKGFFIEMDLLSSCLGEELDSQWTKSEIRKLGCEILQILRNIHKQGIIHRDIKPDNILRDQNGKIYLTDFGLATYFCHDTEINHQIPKQQIGRRKRRDFIGTPYYASIAAHLGYSQTPKSDIESLLYLLCRLHKKHFPLNSVNSQREKLRAIENYKIHKGRQWLKECDICFLKVYDYLRTCKKSALNYQQIDEMLKPDRRREKKIEHQVIFKEANRQQTKQYAGDCEKSDMQMNTEDGGTSLCSLQEIQSLGAETPVNRMGQYHAISFKNPFISKQQASQPMII